MNALKDSLKCLFIALACALALGVNVLIWRLPKMVNQQSDQTRGDVIAAVNHQADATRTGIIAELGRWERDANSRIGLVISRADAMTAEGLVIVHGLADPEKGVGAVADRRLASIQLDVDGQLGRLNSTAAALGKSTAALEDRYRTLPDEMRADREYQGLVAETMGVLGATKVTLGQAAKASKTLDEALPGFIADGKTIADDATREADALTAPQSFWAKLRTWLLTVARIYGAVY